MDESILCKDVLSVIFSFLPGQYSVFVKLCKEAKSILKTDGWDALIAYGVSIEIDDYTLTWTKNGKKHSILSLPAVERNGVLKWYKDGMKHRDGGLPAYVGGGELRWYVNGALHREGDLPALIKRFGTGTGEWCDSYYVNDELHRDNDLPAIIDLGKNELSWCKNGKLHRENGPAVFSPGTFAGYYVNGKMQRDVIPAFIYSDGMDVELRWYQSHELARPDTPTKPIAVMILNTICWNAYLPAREGIANRDDIWNNGNYKIITVENTGEYRFMTDELYKNIDVENFCVHNGDDLDVLMTASCHNPKMEEIDDDYDSD